jgi:hypothetical protein
MTITLNHTIVPAHDKGAAAQFFAGIFGLHADPKGGHFAPVRINDTLTLLFDDHKEFESHHYAFHVNNAEFDAILDRVREAKLAYGSAPSSLDDGKLNDWNGGRGRSQAAACFELHPPIAQRLERVAARLAILSLIQVAALPRGAPARKPRPGAPTIVSPLPSRSSSIRKSMARNRSRARAVGCAPTNP